MKKGKKVAIIVVLSILAILIAAGGYVYSKLNKFEKVEISKNDEDLGITEETKEIIDQYEGAKEIRNIALLGIDAEDGQAGRSDSIIILTIDTLHSKVKLTSIMRDSYVNIPGRGMDKINHAYAFGGPELSLRTINENFNLNIKEFASLDFTTLPRVIDTVGGIELTLTPEEVAIVNHDSPSMAKKIGTTTSTLSGSGKLKLDGTQSLTYSRIRKIDNDYERTQRQRNVLNAVFNKFKDTPPTEYLSLLDSIAPLIKTNINTGDMLNYGKMIYSINNKKLYEDRIPRDESGEGKNINGVYYLTFDIATARDQMHKNIFEDR